jgi:hypothetical protein
MASAAQVVISPLTICKLSLTTSFHPGGFPGKTMDFPATEQAHEIHHGTVMFNYLFVFLWLVRPRM